MFSPTSTNITVECATALSTVICAVFSIISGDYMWKTLGVGMKERGCGAPMSVNFGPPVEGLAGAPRPTLAPRVDCRTTAAADLRRACA